MYDLQIELCSSSLHDDDHHYYNINILFMLSWCNQHDEIFSSCRYKFINLYSTLINIYIYVHILKYFLYIFGCHHTYTPHHRVYIDRPILRKVLFSPGKTAFFSIWAILWCILLDGSLNFFYLLINKQLRAKSVRKRQ